jgi:hypothetical protein
MQVLRGSLGVFGQFLTFRATGAQNLNFHDKLLFKFK